VNERSVKSAASSAIYKHIPMNVATSVWCASRNSYKLPTLSHIWKSTRVLCLHHPVSYDC